MNVNPKQISWTPLKDIKTSTGHDFYYVDDNPKFTKVYLINEDHNELLVHRLPPTGADRTDWTNNYEGTATELASDQLMDDVFFKVIRNTSVIIRGRDQAGNLTVPVATELIDGKNRLLTSGIVQIEELFGQDNQADTWFYLGTQYDIGPISAGDTVRIQIAAGPDPVLFPAIDLTYTVTAGDVADPNPEEKVATGIVQMLNADSVFRQLWRAQRIADNSTVWIGSKILGEWSERPNPLDFQVTVTGTITVLVAFDRVIRRGKSTSLTKDPNDPRLGVIGITGTVAQGASSLGQLHFDQPSLNADEATFEMAVNGSVTPQEFIHPAHVGEDIFVNELRLFAAGNGIKYGQFLNQNQPLTNGILIEVKSDDAITQFPVIYRTEDMKNRFANGIGWLLEVQAGGDQVLATFTPASPFPQRAIGTFTTDDYIKVVIRDNLSQVSSLQMQVYGFTVEV